VYGPGRFAGAVARKPWGAVPHSTLFYGAQPVNEDAAAKEGPESDPIFANMLRQESGNRQFDHNGVPITSPKGAVGAAQIMPATGPQAAKLAGEDWSLDRLYKDPDYNKRLGRAYFDYLRDQFGDPALGAAAYNAGPKAVERALAMEKEGGGSWLDHLPEETKAYVRNVVLAGNEDGRVMRASGGKVEGRQEKIERLVNRLMGLAKSAKKVENKKTEPLLKVADEVVARALHDAQKSI
jgi:soluble lytic murein transglycosylase-like protein